MMTFIESQLGAWIGRKFSANHIDFVLSKGDNFEYKDFIDGLISKKQVCFLSISLKK